MLLVVLPVIWRGMCCQVELELMLVALLLLALGPEAYVVGQDVRRIKTSSCFVIVLLTQMSEVCCRCYDSAFMYQPC